MNRGGFMKLVRVSFFTSFLFLLALVHSQNLQDYPDYQESFLNDYAGVVSSVDASVLRAETAFLKDETGIELTVLTIDSIYDYSTGDNTIESFAENLFKTWGLNSDAALILVAVQDRNVRIELGESYGYSNNYMTQMVIDQYMLPQFRQSDYSTGTLHGSQELNRQLRAINSGVPVSTQFPQPNAYPTSQPVYNQPSYSEPSYSYPRSSNEGWLATTIATLFGGGGGLYLFARRRRRYAARDCQNCQHELHLLDELSDDVYLDDGQLAEEYLESVDYDVWLCNNCNQHELHTYPAFFSGYKNCPHCRYRTMKTKRRTLERPGLLFRWERRDYDRMLARQL